MTWEYRELQRVTGGYKGLQGVTGGYKRLQGVTGGDKSLKDSFLFRTSANTFSRCIFDKHKT